MTTAMIVLALLLLAIVGPRVIKIYIFDVVDRQMAAASKYDPAMSDEADAWFGGTLRSIDELPETDDPDLAWR